VPAPVDVYIIDQVSTSYWASASNKANYSDALVSTLKIAVLDPDVLAVSRRLSRPGMCTANVNIQPMLDFCTIYWSIYRPNSSDDYILKIQPRLKTTVDVIA